jgi:DNA helicase II / ATP-dependent DNA helicase PcrA
VEIESVEHSFFDKEIERLNPQQRQAVCHQGGPALVIAGAGSGKTRVATMRVANLIRAGAAPQTIVAVTFTNKAAKEMRERVNHLVGSDVLVSTFHSLGAKILRESINLLGYPQAFAIYAEDESEKTLKNCLKDRGFQCKDAEVSTYKAAFSKIKNNSSTLQFFDSLTQSLFEQYQLRLKQSGAVDFDDLIYLPLELFKQFPEVRNRYSQRWNHILVDEYQDTSDSQCQFASSLAGSNLNIFAVGDPDQSIYSWRGAKITNILSFQNHFPNATIIRLEQNYRSTNMILKASNALISCNERRLDKALWSERGAGEPIIRFIAQTERQEAEFVTSTIPSLLSEHRGYDHFAILYRTNAQSRPLEDRLIEHHIPYKIWGGTPFYSRREIKDVLSLLQIASLPQDLVSFERALKTVGKGIGDVTIAKLRQAAIDTNRPIFEIAQDAANGEGDVTKKQQENLAKFCSLISSLRALIEQGSAFDLISSAIHDSGYQEVLEKDPETLSERRENLEQLLSRSQEWDDLNDGASPLLFIEELVLEGSREQNGENGPQVTLSSVHNAKGLEFPVVFIVGLEEDLFPHINAKKGNDEVEEERRLFYVGMTRAKDRLFLSASQTRFLFGGLHRMKISRFLKEIPNEYIKSEGGAIPYAASSFHSSGLKRSGCEEFEEQPYRVASPSFKEQNRREGFGGSTIKETCSFVEKKTSSAVSPAAPPSPEKFIVGQIVLHPQFGIGKVEAITETSAGTAYEVLFSNDQTKRKILSRYSPMKSISSKAG